MGQDHWRLRAGELVNTALHSGQDGGFSRRSRACAPVLLGAWPTRTRPGALAAAIYRGDRDGVARRLETLGLGAVSINVRVNRSAENGGVPADDGFDELMPPLEMANRSSG